MDEKPDTVMLHEGYRLVVPPGAQKELLKLLHIPHMGLVKTKRAAAIRYYFQGMSGRIKQMTVGCAVCQRFEASKTVEPLLQPVFRPERTAMERVAIDLFHFGGSTYLLMIDAFSNYPLVKKFGKSSSTDKVIKQVSNGFILLVTPVTSSMMTARR